MTDATNARFIFTQTKNVPRNKHRQEAVYRLTILFATPLIALVVLGLAFRVWLAMPHLFPLYITRRVGLDGQLFRMVKIRTMDDRRKLETLDQNGNQMKHIPPFCAKLRSWHLDELPQLFNVLWGTMNLIGPRPMDLADFERLRRRDGPTFGVRLQVKPGITGLDQLRTTRTRQQLRTTADAVFLQRYRSLKLDGFIIKSTISKMLGCGGHVH